MKTNEAPEKIFLEWYRIGDKKYRDWCIMPKTNDESVEYTHTDAFIEKACEWLKDNIYHRVYECGDRLGFPTAEFIDEFRKYMKGE